jgi:alginate O-acetyltransferase complex protein AlgJ
MAGSRVEENMVLEGKDGTLFLQNDTNDIIAQVEGRHPVTDQDLYQIASEHAGRHAFLRAIGANYLHIIAPDKESYLAEKLPDTVRPRAFGPSPLERYFASPAVIVHRPMYFLDAMRKALGPRAFLTSDTHWTSRAAAWYLTEALRGQLPLLAEAIHGLPKTTIAMEIEGDLGRKIGRRKEATAFLVPDPIKAKLIFDNGDANYGRIRVYRSDRQAGIGKLIFLHDSFLEWAVPILAECARETVFVQMSEIDRKFCDRFRPDVVICQQVERFFVRPPHPVIDWNVPHEL